MSWEQYLMSWELDNCAVGTGYYVMGMRSYVVGTR